MDSDVLIKVAKASVKDLIASNFEVHIPPKVKDETVNEGRARGYPDAPVIDENIRRGKLRIVETMRTEDTEKLISGLNLLGGEADSIRLFRQGSYEAIASDDSRFIELAEGLGIPYLTPSALLIYLRRSGAASRQEIRRCLDRIKELISPKEYLASLEELGKEE